MNDNSSWLDDKYTYKLLYTPNIAIDATISRTHPIFPKIKFTSTWKIQKDWLIDWHYSKLIMCAQDETIYQSSTTTLYA